jgi:GMP synthase (glutamine-hydrolysing)
VRELAVNCEIIPYTFILQDIISLKPGGIILSGILDTAHGSDAPVGDRGIFDLEIPVLGI